MKEEKRRKWKERLKTVIIIVLIIIIILLLLRGCEGECAKTAVIDEGKQVELQDTSSGKVRIKMSPQVNIKKGIMQDLDFCNYNENRLLTIKIINDDKSIYESPFINSGDVLKGDYINVKSLAKGANDAVAEVYSYDLNRKLMGQTNVKFILNYIS